MKRLALLFATALAAGCAVSKPAPVVVEPAHVEYKPAAASALVFDSPVTPDYPLLGLDRDDRQPSAFLGYDQTIVESFFIYTDDDQNGYGLGCQDNYQREAIYAKSGTRTR